MVDRRTGQHERWLADHAPRTWRGRFEIDIGTNLQGETELLRQRSSDARHSCQTRRRYFF